MSNLPAEVHNLFTTRARSLVMTNYVGGRKRLDDTPHSREMWHHYLYLRSWGPSNDRAKNLRLLRRLVKQGLLVESRSCEFKLPTREQVNDFCEAALRHWLAEGYDANRTMMPPGTCDPREFDHWNSPDVLPPVGCPIVLHIGCAVVQAERTAHIERRDREMTYQLPGGQVLTGRYEWSYP